MATAYDPGRGHADGPGYRTWTAFLIQTGFQGQLYTVRHHFDSAFGKRRGRHEARFSPREDREAEIRLGRSVEAIRFC